MKLYVKKKGVKIMNIEFKIGAGGFITIILVLAKLFGLFPYSWWIVVTPLLIAYAITFAFITYAAFVLADDSDDR